MDENVRLFNGVRFYPVEELAMILAGFATTWSKSTQKFAFKDHVQAKTFATISEANARAYERYHGARKVPHVAEAILAALPKSPVTDWLGLQREFGRRLHFNLTGHEFSYDTCRDEDSKILDLQAQKAEQAMSPLYPGDVFPGPEILP